MDNNLIYDFGFHRGEDTAFYLAKGFRVIALEANPTFTKAATEQFGSEIAKGLLVVVNAVLAESCDENIPFYVNQTRPSWSSSDRQVAARRNSEIETIHVPPITLNAMFQEYGVPYYLKIDVEASDIIALRQLAAEALRPKYISVELGPDILIDMLVELGYSRFKLVNQALNQFIKLPRVPLEGRYVGYHFLPGGSGPFGNEAPGQWEPVEDLKMGLKALRELRRREPQVLPHGSWFDVHAVLAE